MIAEYVGDGVYLSGDGNGFILTTGSHLPSQAEYRIYLDPEVAVRLHRLLGEAISALPSVSPLDDDKVSDDNDMFMANMFLSSGL